MKHEKGNAIANGQLAQYNYQMGGSMATDVLTRRVIAGNKRAISGVARVVQAQNGGNKFTDFFKKAGNVINNGLKSSKIVSTLGNAFVAPVSALAGVAGGPLAGAAAGAALKSASTLASSNGYGRPPAKKGKGKKK